MLKCFLMVLRLERTPLYLLRSPVAAIANVITDDRLKELIETHEGMIRTIAMRWFRINQDLELEDLISEVRLGFIEAAHRFDPERGFTFGTYATPWGENYIRRYVRREVNRGIHISSAGPITRIAVQDIDSPISSGDENTIAKLIAQKEPDHNLVPVHIWDHIRQMLTPRQYEVLEHYLRFNTQQKEIAEKLNVTRTRISQIIVHALQTLRLKRHKLMDYWEGRNNHARGSS